MGRCRSQRRNLGECPSRTPLGYVHNHDQLLSSLHSWIRHRLCDHRRTVSTVGGQGTARGSPPGHPHPPIENPTKTRHTSQPGSTLILDTPACLG
jgi:hypothetical protein